MEQRPNRPGQSTSNKSDSKEFPLVEVAQTFRASPEDVFKIFADERMYRQWWGPTGYFCPYAKVDFRQDGKYLVAIQVEDESQPPIYSTGEFKTIDPNRRIQMTDQFADKDGNVITPKEAGMQDWEGDGVAFITFNFEPVEGGTRLYLAHEGIPAKMHDECVEGWKSIMNRIKYVVEKH
jgi:uncharacterized protein YndB with AHSA1/START domain